MPRTLLAALLLWIVALPCMATVELNSATVAELDSIKGIGPATSRAILAERSRAPFTDWADFMRRVKGVREAHRGPLLRGRPDRAGRAIPRHGGGRAGRCRRGNPA